MYWPYLRGKQEEVLGVKAIFPVLKSSPLIVPIYSPVNTSNATLNRFLDIAKSGGRIAVIINPADGDPVPKIADVITLVDDVLKQYPNKIFPSIEIRDGTTVNDISSFAKKYSKSQCSVIHRDHSIGAQSVVQALSTLSIKPVHVFVDGQAPSGMKKSIGSSLSIILRDGFKKQASNGLYKRSSVFDDLVYSYGSMSYNGFGDFATIGDIFTVGGSEPSHVALHLTEPVTAPAVRIDCNHFVSTSSVSSDVAVKYANALSLLMKHTGRPPRAPLNTQGTKEFHATTAKYPGLGKPKRFSLMHHIELMHSIITAAGAKPIV
jgi:hypothetical protein